ncbi:7-keto-8-aminopelargonate synthetase, partial [Pseudoalteromonas rubra]
MSATNPKVNPDIMETLQQEVLKTFTELTEYPANTLDLTSHLENDFGIDSIALAEVTAALTKQLQLKTPLSIQNIHCIADAVKQIAAQEFHLSEAKTTGSSDGKQNAHSWLREQVITVFASFSGYNATELSMDAEIESDLGIDSVTVVSAQGELLKALGLRDNLSIPSCKTLAELEQAFAKLLVEEKGAQWADELVTKNPLIDELLNPATRGDDVQHQIDSDDGDNRTMRDFVGIQHGDLFHKAREFKSFYDKKKAQQLYWYGMPLETPCKNRAVMFDEVTGTSREFL